MSEFFLGLELGQSSDFTALAIVERPDVQANPVLALRYLHRFQVGTPYGTVFTMTTKLIEVVAVQGGLTLIVDQTAVGQTLVEQMKRTSEATRIVPVTITAGHTFSVNEDGLHHVPKKDLVGSLQWLLQNRRVKLPRSLPLVDTLVKELGNFRIKVPTVTNDSMAMWREGRDDDLVFALAIAAWKAEKGPHWGPNPYGAGYDSVLLNTPGGEFDIDKMYAELAKIHHMRF